MIGVDEAGRGSWAGPLVAVAVRLRADWQGRGLRDSKLLAPATREKLAADLESAGEEFALGIVEAEEIDGHGLSWAQREAMRRAVGQLRPVSGEEIVVDGSINYLREAYAGSRAVVKADRIFPAVMAASILAKVRRDRLMVEFSRRYPGYGFEAHKGYGTAGHRTALAERGACQIHRRSWRPIRGILTRS